MISIAYFAVAAFSSVGLADQPAPVGVTAPVAGQPLQVGEVLLEINAAGEASSQADTAELSVTLTARGADEARARSAYALLSRQVDEAITASGAASPDITRGDVTVNTMPADVLPNTGPDVQRAVAMSNYTIRLRDAARAGRLNQALSRVENVFSRIQYSVTDDSAAQRTARLQALTKARTEAEGYAAALNMRIVRMVRVTERTGINVADVVGMEGPMRARINQAMGSGGTAAVPTLAYVGVDYVLAPR